MITAAIQEFGDENNDILLDLIKQDFSAAPETHVHVVDGRPVQGDESRWSAHSAVGFLTDALSRLYLPDLGQLPFDALAEMKQILLSDLDPMRAELLRLSEDLRKMVGLDRKHLEIEREAEVLVATRVEPLVREAAQRAEDMAKRKWRRFFQGVGRVLGLTGAAFVKPEFLKDALKEILDTGVALADREDSKEPLTDTAHFVLEARRFVIERSEGA
jgi:hypothetical protein